MDGYPSFSLRSQNIIHWAERIGADDLGNRVFNLFAAQFRDNILQDLNILFDPGSGSPFDADVQRVIDLVHKAATGERDRFVLERFPAGKARIQYETSAGVEGAAEVEVPVDGVLEVAVP